MDGYRGIETSTSEAVEALVKELGLELHEKAEQYQKSR